jgi:hypothetical protein
MGHPVVCQLVKKDTGNGKDNGNWPVLSRMMRRAICRQIERMLLRFCRFIEVVRGGLKLGRVRKKNTGISPLRGGR